MKRFYFYASLAAMALLPTVVMQADSPNYVNCGPAGTSFAYSLENWSPGQKWCDDDNFFISRVRPKERFRNIKTQILPMLTEDIDKNLIYWVPIGTPPLNAVPTGCFDGDVFNMWSYVTHYGNWSAPFMRSPGNFADVAHKNGVGVSTIAATAYGTLNEEWARSFTKLIGLGADKVSEYIKWYGLDGLSYNSEFQYPVPMYEGVSTTLVKELAALNAGVMARSDLKAPAYANIWYDGTNDNGVIQFDNGLSYHNVTTFGYGEGEASALFLNYNWNTHALMTRTVNSAKELGRNPLDIYVGFNMQGKEPSPANPCWTLLQSYPLSIGLWGAHSENMMYESRNEAGFTPEAKQRTYLIRNEKWFTGSNRNPANRPKIIDEWGCSVNSTDFFGMASFMSARSSLKWDLSKEPFITSFNLGNGKFFNWEGERADQGEWCNIGVQDYMPTWRWWWSSKFLGRDASDVPAKGLEANFVWVDAYMGGSLINITGSTREEYLHLFKTSFELKDGDEISLTYRLNSGESNVKLAFSVEGAEETPILSPKVVTSDAVDAAWHTSTFVVGKDIPELAGKTLALIALNFEWSNKLDLNLGRLVVRRPSADMPTPAAPVIEKAEALAYDMNGIDAKLIYNMPNNVEGRVCYNDDVNTSMFKIYYQQENEEPRLKGITTSWAALLYHAAVNNKGCNRVRFGVSALSVDYASESAITWSEWIDCGDLYSITPGIEHTADEAFVKEPFDIHFIDPRQPADYSWSLADADGKVVAKADNATGLTLDKGVDKAGYYTLTLTGPDGKAQKYQNYINILNNNTARSPKILSFDFTKGGYADSKDANMIGDADLVAGQQFDLAYTGRHADGVRSRGLHITGPGYGFKTADADVNNSKPFSLSLWLCPENLTSVAQIFNLRDKTDVWAKNEWGMIYQTYDPVTKVMQLCVRITNNVNEYIYTYTYNNVEIKNGEWYHLGYSFDFNSTRKVNIKLTLNGEPLEPDTWAVADESGTGNPGQIGNTPAWRQHYVVAIGGNLFKNAGIEGYIDQFQIFDKALSFAQLKECYNTRGYYNPDNSLVAAYSFDKNASDNFTFMPDAGKNMSVPTGIITYVAEELEGQGKARWVKPAYGPGSPVVESKNVVTTKAEWILPPAELTQSSGNDVEGKASGKFNHNGTFRVRLRLSNDCGSDEQTFRFITVAQGVHVGAVVDESRLGIDSFSFDGDNLLLWISGDNDYMASVASIDGRMVSAPTLVKACNSPVVVKCPGAPGIYVVTLTGNDGKPLTLKFQKRH